MSSLIDRVYAHPDVRQALERLDFNGVPAKTLLAGLDAFLTKYATANEVNGTEPRSEDEDEELADITTAWLDDERQGVWYWPVLDDPWRLQYNARGHDM